MDASIIIVNYNTRDLTLSCIKSVIKNTKGIDYEIILIDNGSKEKFSDLKIEKCKLEIVQNKTNIGFAAANNQGTKKAKGEYVLYLNSDTIVHDNAIGEMISWMNSHPKAGVASCALRNKDGSEQGTGGYFPTLLNVFSWMTIQDIPGVDLLILPFHPMKAKSFLPGKRFWAKEKELDWLTGAFMLARRAVVEKVGGWDEGYFMYTEEVDFCCRLKKAGWEVWYIPNWSITHIGGASSSTEDYSVLKEYGGVKRFFRKYYPRWQFPVLRIILKIGALGRMVLFGILEGKGALATYAKAFWMA